MFEYKIAQSRKFLRYMGTIFALSWAKSQRLSTKFLSIGLLKQTDHIHSLFIFTHSHKEEFVQHIREFLI